MSLKFRIETKKNLTLLNLKCTAYQSLNVSKDLLFFTCQTNFLIKNKVLNGSRKKNHLK